MSRVLWIMEWGAVDLPMGHPSRITCMQGYATEEEARGEAAKCEFNTSVFPVAALTPRPAAPLATDAGVADSMPTMSAAFRTTEVLGGDKPKFQMVFKFPTMEAMHAADDEWRNRLAGVAGLGSQTLDVKAGALTNEQIEREFLKWGAEPADVAWRVASPVERTRRTFREAFRIAESLLATQPRPSDADVRDAGRWKALTEERLDAYLNDYETVDEAKDGQGAYRRLTGAERHLIKDAVMGFLADAKAATPPAAQGKPEAGEVSL